MPEIYCKDCEHFDKCDRGYMPDCPVYYPKKGIMTNEEWLEQASTEEKAIIIYGIAMYDTLYDRIHNAFVLNPCEDDSAGINEVMKWLKEIHND